MQQRCCRYMRRGRTAIADAADDIIMLRALILYAFARYYALRVVITLLPLLSCYAMLMRLSAAMRAARVRVSAGVMSASFTSTIAQATRYPSQTAGAEARYFHDAGYFIQ